MKPRQTTSAEAPTSAARTMASNSMAIYARTLASVFLALLGSRWTFLGLGQDDLGIYTVVVGVVGFLGILTGAMTQSAQRFLALGAGSDRSGCDQPVLQRVADHPPRARRAIARARGHGRCLGNPERPRDPDGQDGGGNARVSLRARAGHSQHRDGARLGGLRRPSEIRPLVGARDRTGSSGARRSRSRSGTSPGTGWSYYVLASTAVALSFMGVQVYVAARASSRRCVRGAGTSRTGRPSGRSSRSPGGTCSEWSLPS